MALFDELVMITATDASSYLQRVVIAILSSAKEEKKKKYVYTEATALSLLQSLKSLLLYVYHSCKCRNNSFKQ